MAIDLLPNKTHRIVLREDYELVIAITSGSVGVSSDDASISETVSTSKTFGPYEQDVVFYLNAFTGTVATYDNSVKFIGSQNAEISVAQLQAGATGVAGVSEDGKVVLPDGNDRIVNLGVTPNNILFCIGGMDARSNFSDKSGRGATCLVESGNTGAFANDTYMSTIAGTDGGLTIPNNRFAWNPARESLIHAFVIKKSTPASNEVIVAFGGGNTSNDAIGYYLSHRASTGAIKIVPTIASSAINAQADSSLSFNSSARDMHCCVVYDAETGLFAIYKDGVLSDAFTATPMTGPNAYPDVNILYDYQIGGFASNSTPATTVATLTYGHQAYKFFGSLPINVGAIVSSLAANPRNPIVTV